MDKAQAESWFERGCEAIEKRDSKTAFRAFRFCLQGDAPPWMKAAAMNNVALIYEDSREPDRASEAYEYSLRFDPDNEKVLSNYGILLKELGEFDRAEKMLRQASASGDPLAMFRHSILLLLLGRFGEGWRRYDERLKFKNYFEAMSGLRLGSHQPASI